MSVVDLEHTQNQTMSSPIGFEGYEKRLEVTFSAAPLSVDPKRHHLRSLSRSQIDSFLDLAQCTVVSSLSNEEFDSYVLSESSLFIYPHKLILKTCGTTKLLLAIPRILELASELSLPVLSAKYSRGSFIFPDAQPTPHRSFSEEVTVLDNFFGDLSSGGRAYVIGDPEMPNRNWHIYYACDQAEKPVVTVEMCMTGLDTARASVFFREASDGYVRTAKEMTQRSGISDIIPEMNICDFEFDPCGYSMNGITGAGALSTIHVTPEEGFSYASYEAMGFDPSLVDPAGLTSRVLKCFQPSEFSVAVTVFGGGRAGAGPWVKDDLSVAGYSCRDVVEQELPGEGLLVYRTFTAQAMSPRSILNCWDEGEDSDGCEEQKMKLKKRPRTEEENDN